MVEFTDKRSQIIYKAQRLFATYGFAATSVRDIAREADVNIAMISYYFGSKEKLLEAIIFEHRDFIRLRLESIINDQELSPFQKMESLIDHYIEKHISQPDFHKIVAREQMSSRKGRFNELLLEMKRQNTELIRKIISDGQRKGEFKKGIDIPLMVATMVGTAHQVMTTRHFYKELNNLGHLPDDEFQKLIKRKLSVHLKSLFKVVLIHEA